MQATAAWKCKLELAEGASIIGAAAEADIWIPEGATLTAFKSFKEALPAELQNSRELSDLIEHSPALKHAFNVYINSLDTNAASAQTLSPLLVANHLSRILFNHGETRAQGAEEIAKFLRDMQMRAFASYRADESLT